MYLNRSERARFLSLSEKLAAADRLFCVVLAFTGCRISEALATTVDLVDDTDCVVIFKSLKKRERREFRAVPVPPSVIAELKEYIRAAGLEQSDRLWPWSRTTGWSKVKGVMSAAKIVGAHASPKGLRHGFGVNAIQCGVALSLVQKWLGHAKMETTAIYANAVGEEERLIASRMWG